MYKNWQIYKQFNITINDLINYTLKYLYNTNHFMIELCIIEQTCVTLIKI